MADKTACQSYLDVASSLPLTANFSCKEMSSSSSLVRSANSEGVSATSTSWSGVPSIPSKPTVVVTTGIAYENASRIRTRIPPPALTGTTCVGTSWEKSCTTYRPKEEPVNNSASVLSMQGPSWSTRRNSVIPRRLPFGLPRKRASRISSASSA